MSADDSKNIYGNQYHVREPETRKLKMGFKEFADCVRLWQEDTLFVSVKTPPCSLSPSGLYRLII